MCWCMWQSHRVLHLYLHGRGCVPAHWCHTGIGQDLPPRQRRLTGQDPPDTCSAPALCRAKQALLCALRARWEEEDRAQRQAQAALKAVLCQAQPSPVDAAAATPSLGSSELHTARCQPAASGGLLAAVLAALSVQPPPSPHLQQEEGRGTEDWPPACAPATAAAQLGAALAPAASSQLAATCEAAEAAGEVLVQWAGTALAAGSPQQQQQQFARAAAGPAPAAAPVERQPVGRQAAGSAALQQCRRFEPRSAGSPHLATPAARERQQELGCGLRWVSPCHSWCCI